MSGSEEMSRGNPVDRRHFLAGGIGAATFASVAGNTLFAEETVVRQARNPPEIAPGFPPPMTLWYDRPATKVLEEALPIGNGRLGAMICGSPDDERILLNEITLWSGDDNPSGDYETRGMGFYELLGFLRLRLPDHLNVEEYVRRLSLSRAIVNVSYRVGKVRYERSHYASIADQVIAIHLRASEPSTYTGTLGFEDGHGAQTVARGDTLTIAGQVPDGVRYETRIRVLPIGGKVTAADGELVFEHCDKLTILIAAGTDYRMDGSQGWRESSPPGEKVAAQLGTASEKYCGKPGLFMQDAVSSYRDFFDRVKLDLGASSADRRQLPTDQRLQKYTEDGDDPELESIFFQYGRYLLISSSVGPLPANLQGIWNQSNTPPWHSDYHTNINIQMNYWLAEPTNLTECHRVLLTFLTSQLPTWRRLTASDPRFTKPDGTPTRGWTVRTSHNITGGMGWKWNVPGNAWYAQHFSEHWRFTKNVEFLREMAYPVLKECCEFWEDQLKELEDGRLVVPMGWSPEHGPEEDGCSYDQEIVWDLFTNYLEAATALDVDPEYRKRIASMRERLVVPAIGRWGQLQEWMVDRDDPNDGHRHVSHLFAVHPGRQITPVTTPELAAAAQKSLEARG
ncbi:MAG: glycoside hydrolase family 95 protein, partial [Planctomycetia bacterium]|nr:glycoside hydrolase family 95 protein [Planctomycetia bacterium]